MSKPFSSYQHALLSTAILALVTACGGGSEPQETPVTPAVTETPQNQAPQISGQSQTLKVGDTLNFNPQVSDPDNDPLTISVSNLPNWVNFDKATGAISGIPEQAGVFSNIEFSVSDGQLSAQLLIDIKVEKAREENTSPTLTSTPANANEGQAYAYQLTFSDAQNDTIIVSDVAQPDWLIFDNNTQRFSGTPAFTDRGEQLIRFRYSDGEVSQLAEQIFTVTPRANSLPNISPLATEARAENAFSLTLTHSLALMRKQIPYRARLAMRM
ncbi:putative Ig domain-containing protein [Pseudoalteromonas lipolytica]|uniref:putative Ig domain-containing protein n=1 Tax=Pseudoalteromonas lipolytica TaxID=570156 RepID=UPI00241FE336|nr:putative Ig domain-containing protein [Pseudoalteromonas lipolytica]|tara:strand:- start:17228 stop:18037 length:810 start_codon:yes stop_codon:yes gene_type:complete